MRAEKPLRLMLLPMVPPSAAPIVTPGTLRSAFSIDVAPCDCISALLMTTTVCGTSISSAAPRRLSEPRVTWKSSLGRPPVTVTGCIVAGAAVGSAGLVLGGRRRRIRRLGVLVGRLLGDGSRGGHEDTENGGLDLLVTLAQDGSPLSATDSHSQFGCKRDATVTCGKQQ